MPSQLSLEALAIIDAIERRGSFASAAEELGKATSALSYTVQKLEEQLGVTLFQRQGRQSVLTGPGRLLLEEGRKILAASQLLTDQVKELALGWEPRIRIALESTFDRSVFFRRCASFLEDHPDIELDVQESILSGGWEALEYDRVDLLVGAPGPAPKHKGLRTQPVSRLDMLLVASRDHPTVRCLDDSKALAKAIEASRRVVTHDTSQITVQRSAGLLSSAHVLYVQTLDQKIEAQRNGLGVGHLPEWAISDLLGSGELVLLQRDSNPSPSYLAWKITNKGRGLRALVDLLAD